MNRIVILTAGLVLSGCSMWGPSAVAQSYIKGAVETGIEDRKSWNDTVAGGLDAATCEQSVGAYFRKDARRQAGTQLLCDPDAPMPGGDQVIVVTQGKAGPEVQIVRP